MRNRLIDKLDLMVDFLTLGEYGIEEKPDTVTKSDAEKIRLEPDLTNDDLYDEDGELNRRDTDDLDSCVGTFDDGDAMDHGAGGGDPDEGWDAGYHYPEGMMNGN